MYSLTLLAFSAFVFALLLTPAVRGLARRRGWLDAPGEARRVHAEPVPRLGGVAVMLAYLGAFGALLASEFSAGGMVREALPLVERLLPAVLVIFLVGLADDLKGLRPWQKFLGQSAAAGLAMWGGVTVNGVAGFQFEPWLAVPATVIWLAGCANAFNLIDGVDGLAAGVGFFATVTVLVAALIHGSIGLALAVAPLAGALLGFLRYNFNPATIFLGDCGALTVGFLLGCFGVLWGQKTATLFGLTAPLMALAIPLLDTAIAIARRFLRGQKIWTADRGHIHHRLLEQGLTPRRVALVLYGFAALGAVFSVVQSALQNQFGGLVVIAFCLTAWMGVQHLGYVEFGVAGRLFVDGAFRRHFNAQVALANFEKALRGARSPQACWKAIEEAAEEFGYERVEARIAGREFQHLNGFGAAGEEEYWTVRIPLPGGDFVRLDHVSRAGASLSRVGPFADAIQRILREKLSLARAFALEPRRLEVEMKARAAGARD